jgi:two-component system cell cycle response regulator CpdR
MRILYVEDNDDLRETIGSLMEGEGREIVTCATGEEALALEGGSPFDLLVTDVSLPGISGTDLARRVLSVDPLRWVVLCSGYSFGNALPEFGPNVRALTKPFELDELEALIGEITLALHPAP